MSPTIKEEIIHYSKKLYQKGFVANHDGNISVKTGNHLWATPTAQSKGDVTHEMLVCLDTDGKKVSGTHNVFSEINLHVACYELRKEISVVIHAHPPTATALACTGQTIDPIFIAEAIVTLGDKIPLVPFIPPGCPQTKETLRPHLAIADVLLLRNHGVIAVGNSLEQTYYRLELVEHLATIAWRAKAFGTLSDLPRKTVETLLEKRKKAGLGPKVESTPGTIDLKEIIREELANLTAGLTRPSN